METSPLPLGALTENGLGIGAVSRRMIRGRAAELAVINGRLASELTKADWDQAKLELGVVSGGLPQQTQLDAAPESDRWNPVPGSSGRQAPESPDEDSDDEGQNQEARLFAQGVDEAAHDQMLQSARSVKKPDELAHGHRLPVLSPPPAP